MFEYTCPMCGKVKRVAYECDVRTYCSNLCAARARHGKTYEVGGECVFQPESVMCNLRTCGKCGWNPVVAKARLDAFMGKANG